jgi:ribosomal protein L21
MFAVIKTGGKQYRVAANDVITVATLEGEAGAAVTFGDVLLFTDGDATQVGTPLLSGIGVTGEIVQHGRTRKVAPPPRSPSGLHGRAHHRDQRRRQDLEGRAAQDPEGRAGRRVRPGRR